MLHKVLGTTLDPQCTQFLENQAQFHLHIRKAARKFLQTAGEITCNINMLDAILISLLGSKDNS